MKLTEGDTFYGTHADLLNALGIKNSNGEKFKQYNNICVIDDVKKD